jgi:hypothetical protein
MSTAATYQDSSRNDSDQRSAVRLPHGGKWLARICALMLAILLSIGWPAQSSGYAVLSHEAIIDSAWDTSIRPLLLRRFPNATAEEL